MHTIEYWQNQYSLCISFAAYIHRNQFRRDGVESYINHVMRVSRNVQMNSKDYFSDIETEHVKGQYHAKAFNLDAYWIAVCAAVLHDVYEDGNHDELILCDLKNDINNNIITAAKMLNKNQYEAYSDYIDEILQSKILSVIKVFDIQDNFSNASEKKSKIYLQSWNKLVRKHDMKKFMGKSICLESPWLFTAAPLDLL